MLAKIQDNYGLFVGISQHQALFLYCGLYWKVIFTTHILECEFPDVTILSSELKKLAFVALAHLYICSLT